MIPLIEMYNEILQKMKTYSDSISESEAKIKELGSANSREITERIKNLEELLVKIDDYLLKVKGFQELAKKNLESPNVLTIEAYPGYRVNLNRLRNWAMMIDPSSSNDPYAQRVYVVAKCDECFLLKKQKEFREKIETLRNDSTVGVRAEIDKLEKYIAEQKEALAGFSMSEDISGFARAVVRENSVFWMDTVPERYSDPSYPPESYAFGAYAAPLRFDKPQLEMLKGQFGRYLDSERRRVMIPAAIPGDREFVITVECIPSMRNVLDSAMQNLVLNVIDKNPAGLQKVYVIDGLRYSTASMGTLRQLEDTFAMPVIPRNPDRLTETLEEIVSSFSDIDDILGLSDSVREYNRTAEAGKKLSYSTLLIFGWPNSYEGRNAELLMRIMNNYERYGVSLVIVSYGTGEKKPLSARQEIPDYALYNAVRIKMGARESTIAFPDEPEESFCWYTFSGDLPAEYIISLKEHKVGRESIGNEYTRRYNISGMPDYVRKYKDIMLPFGIDMKDQSHSLSFENENFAAYLVGASRSGKSTLLHTLIASLVWNYHPDNLELWLADFKQLEFKRYMKHCPPHVKYILLDESTELVFDLIDKLTAEMLQRQKLFSRLGVQRINQVDTTVLTKPLPVIFVILDEFSIMSQQIQDNDIYRLRLQNILAKGAALGIKFIFSSQTFTSGVRGLTATARAQIQQRIVMKSEKSEIVETLDLSSNQKTEQVRNWMDALPPHYALVKARSGPDTPPEVKRFLVMYFEDYVPRDEMIDRISRDMKAVEEYSPGDIGTYVDKHPVLVDGNSFDRFDAEQFMESVSAEKAALGDDLSGDETFAAFGTPRLMSSTKITAITPETRENILLIGRMSEQSCAASVLMSAITAFRLHGRKTEIWAYGKNNLYRSYGRLLSEGGTAVYEGIDAVCGRIRELKQKIRDKAHENTLIVMIGMDRICMDFSFIDTSAADNDLIKEKAAETDRKFEALRAATDEEKLNAAFAKYWASTSLPRRRELKKAGYTKEEITKHLKAEYERAEKEFRLRYQNEAAPDNEKQAEDVEKKEEMKPGAYDAMDDLKYIVKFGSRLGYHTMLYLNSLADLKLTGLALDLFRYRMTFQISADDSRDLGMGKVASTLPEHICQYDDSLERYSFRPYLHRGIGWEGWYVDENDNVINPFEDTEF